MSWKIENDNLVSFKLNNCILYVYKEENGIRFKIVEQNKNNKEIIIFSKSFDNSYLGIKY